MKGICCTSRSLIEVVCDLVDLTGSISTSTKDGGCVESVIWRSAQVESLVDLLVLWQAKGSGNVVYADGKLFGIPGISSVAALDSRWRIQISEESRAIVPVGVAVWLVSNFDRLDPVS